MSTDSWIHNFAITETRNHENKYTLYKITAIIFPRDIPEALSNVSVWRRYSEIKKLYKEIRAKQKLYRLKGAFPKFEQKSYFNRFNLSIIEERKKIIIELLYYIAQHAVLYKSETFITFFNENRPFQPSIIDGSIIEPTPTTITQLQDNHQQNEIIKLPSSDVLKGKPPLEPDEINGSGIDELVDSSTDSNNYIYEAALEFSNALQSDVNGAYDIAFQKYTSGVGILLTGARNDMNFERQSIAKEKAQKYLTKADDIYQTFLSNDHSNHSITKFDADGTRDKIIVTDVDDAYLKLPTNALTKYRIIKIINSVLQVQDVTNKNIHIMKVIQKYSCGSIYLRKRIPYMVSVQNYIETDDSIFVLLKKANGGRLWDYITRTLIHPKSGGGYKKSNLKDLFVEKVRFQNSKLSMSISSLITNETTSGMTSPKSSSICSLNEYNSNLGELSNRMRELDSILMVTEKISDSEEVKSIDHLSEMDTNDLVDSSQQLLRSVSETLEWSNKSPTKVIPTTEIGSVAIKDSTAEPEFLPEGSIRRWIAELIVAVEHLHKSNIVCGDLRMDNLLLGSNGQLQLTLFCVQHKNDADILRFDFDFNTNMYVAPERPLSNVSDWWSVGIILFELLFLKPFYFYHPGGIYKYYSIQYPQTAISKEAKSLLKGLLAVDPAKRYDIESIKSHGFFRDVNWTEVYRNGFNK